MASKDCWRVFIAVELPTEIRAKLLDHITRLRECVPQAKASWTRPENIHLTLKFLGDTPLPQIQRLSEAASRALAGLKPFTIELGGSGAFPPRGAAKVLWIGLQDSEQKLSELHSRLEEECADLGFPKEARPFHPHLTLARLRQPQHARALGEAHKELQFPALALRVFEVLVIRSELSSAGSKYTTISRQPLSLD